jgi:hypothetical protein
MMTRCHECGGALSMRSAAGLTREMLPGVPMLIPDSIEVLRCSQCDEHFLDAAKSREIDDALEHARREWLRAEAERTIAILREREHVTIGQIEAACGVTPTRLSHAARSADKGPSLALVRLLQAFVVCPWELRRHLARRPLPDIADPLPVASNDNSYLSEGFSGDEGDNVSLAGGEASDASWAA